MSYTQKLIAEIENKYGTPDELSHTQPVSLDEFEIICKSMKHDRAHDVTLFIKSDIHFIFIAKHSYPEGLFRAPSGGVHKDEDFIEGAKREALEETGVEIELEKYILRVKVQFTSSEGNIDWATHAFLAKYKRGKINPQDKNEIREARLVTIDEIPAFQKIMKSSKVGGFHYRAFLTDEVLKRL